VDTIRIANLKQLARVFPGKTVSIYLPTHQAADVRQDVIRLKNLLMRAREELETTGIPRSEVEELLSAAEHLPRDEGFWKCLSQGLAVFLAPGLFHAYRLPLTFSETLTIQHRLNIAPLLPVVDRGEKFHLLALSQNHVRLFEVTRSEIKEVMVKGMPENKREALNYDEVDRGQQVHEGFRGNLGRQAAVFHGQGGIKDTAKSDLDLFLQALNRALDPVLSRETVPLLLGGVEHVVQSFRRMSSYAGLVDRHLTGNCDRLTAQQLHERSWELMQRHFDHSQQQSVQKLHALLGTGRVSCDITDVTGAAIHGRIEVLIADVGQQQRGIFDRNAGKAIVVECEGSEDLVNLAVAETLLHDGVVFAASRDQLPDNSAIGAIYRF
jgi:hypothetical protein